MKHRTCLLLVLALLASGCMSAEQVRAADEKKCLGFSGNDAGFAECLRRLDLQRRALLRRPPIDPWLPRVIIHRPVAAPH